MRDLLNSPFVWAIILSLCFVTLLFSLSSVLSVLVLVVVLITLSLELPQPMLLSNQITSPIFINCVFNYQGKQLIIKLCVNWSISQL